MRHPLLATSAALLLLSASTTPAFAGAPWISIEIPANGLNPATREAFCLIRVYYHENPAYYPVMVTAEGLVDGVRRTVKLTVTETGMPGVYALRYQPEKSGTWMVVARVGGTMEEPWATVIVPINREGQIFNARVPSRRDGEYHIPLRVTATEIDRMLRAQVALIAPDAHALGGLPLLGLLLIPAWRSRRRAA
ncbi:MAG: hypothetical protein SGJ01_04060 [Gemmatimonadota bacterium]|nr:hypothetical protein [Gemmatimonadota bacterium]